MVDYIVTELDGIYSPSEARELAFWILEETTGLSRAAILACKGTQNILNIKNILARLRKKEPIQYIFGHTEWFGLDLKVTPDTLIPRPETAELVELVLHTLPKDQPLRILDIGTGSGCIAIALKKRSPKWQVTALDVSAKALAVAQENAQRNGVEIEFRQADILSDEIEHFDAIVSNPPYVTESEKVSMESNVLDYEPASALFVPDEDPLKFYRRIVSLHAAPEIFFEINSRFADETIQLLQAYNYTETHLYHDIYEHPRMVSGRITD